MPYNMSALISLSLKENSVCTFSVFYKLISAKNKMHFTMCSDGIINIKAIICTICLYCSL